MTAGPGAALLRHVTAWGLAHVVYLNPAIGPDDTAP